jgi:predicted transcriptional regulator
MPKAISIYLSDEAHNKVMERAKEATRSLSYIIDQLIKEADNKKLKTVKKTSTSKP